MGAALTPQLVDVIDTVTGVRTSSSGTVRRLSTCRTEWWGLHVEYRTPEDPDHEAETCWLLPADGLRLSIQRPRHYAGPVRVTRITAARIEHDARHWRTTDMLLGLSVVPGSVPRFASSEEYAVAVTSGALRPVDADLALHAVHRALEQLSWHRNDLGAWLADRGITQHWPPLF